MWEGKCGRLSVIVVVAMPMWCQWNENLLHFFGSYGFSLRPVNSMVNYFLSKKRTTFEHFF
jgi:hypothetical protein